MRITEHEIWAFLLGAAIGSFITYLNLTREKRIISSIRNYIAHLSLLHNLSPAQYRRVDNPKAIVRIASDERVLDTYRWALGVTSEMRRLRVRCSDGSKLGPKRLAAEVIICEELLGLSAMDAVQALRDAKSPDDLGSLRPKNSN